MQLTLREVAELLELTEDDIIDLMRRDGLPVSRVSEHYRVDHAVLLEWATARGRTLPEHLFPAPVATHPALADCLRAGGIHRDLCGSDRASVLRAVTEVLTLPPDVDRAYLLSMLLAREELASTGIGDGIAIPHVRGPLILPVASPLVALCRLQQPVEFGAVDGKPVHTLFTLICPTVRVHLHLLSRLAYVLKDGGVRAALGGRSDGAVFAAVAAAEQGLRA